jgi:2TM domain-containing protein
MEIPIHARLSAPPPASVRSTRLGSGGPRIFPISRPVLVRRSTRITADARGRPRAHDGSRTVADLLTAMAAIHDAPPTEPPTLRAEAVKRLEKKRDFHAHLLVFALTNALVWVVWALTMPSGFPWPVLLTGAWGIGVVMNAWDVYYRRPFTEAEVRHEMDRLDRS